MWKQGCGVIWRINAITGEEPGDLFFALVNISRFLGVNPDEALRKTISKFIHRFRHIEEQAENTGRSLNDMTLDEMEALWQKAKKAK